MIRTLEVNCAAIHDSSQDAGKTAAETGSDLIVMESVRVLCEFSLLVSQQHHSNLSLKALDNALKRFHQKQGIFQDQKMSKSAKANVDELLATESHLLRKQNIYKIHAAMEALAYGVEKVCTLAENISVRMEWLHQSGCALSEWSETSQWQIRLRPTSIQSIALHISHRLPFRHFILLCWSPMLNTHSDVVANCDHKSELVHWVHDCIRLAM